MQLAFHTLRIFLLLIFAALVLTGVPNLAPARSGILTVYDKQKPVTEKELLQFLNLLPQFRLWAHEHREEAHPTLTRGRPDFMYSNRAAKWVQERGLEPRRFFCVMGKMAAALVVVEEGNDFRGTRPMDMPKVEESEVKLAAKHLDKMLAAGGNMPPKVAPAPVLPKEKPVLPPKPKSKP